MPLNQQAQFLSNDYLAKGLLENDPKRLQHLFSFPFYPIDGNSLTYVRTPELPLAATTGFGEAIPDQTTIPDPSISFPLVELATGFEIAYKASDIFEDTNDQTQLQIDLAIRRLLYRFSQEFTEGDTTTDPNTFNGLRKLVAPANVVDVGAQPLTLENLDRAKGLIKVNNGYTGVLLTNQAGYEKIRTAYYNVGVDPDNVTIAVPNEQKVTAFDGWPILINDLQPTVTCDGVTTTTIWFAILGWNGLHGIIPSTVEESLFLTRFTNKPDGTDEVGHVTLPVGIALGSQSALSAVTNILV